MNESPPIIDLQPFAAELYWLGIFTTTTTPRVSSPSGRQVSNNSKNLVPFGSGGDGGSRCVFHPFDTQTLCVFVAQASRGGRNCSEAVAIYRLAREPIEMMIEKRGQTAEAAAAAARTRVPLSSKEASKMRAAFGKSN